MVCPLCKYTSMYIDFHMLLLLSFGFFFVLFIFGISIWSPCLRSSVTQTWEASSMILFTMSRPSLTTPMSLLMPASLIAPHPSKDADNLRLRYHSRAQNASASMRPTLGPMIVFHLNSSGGWTLDLQRVDPSLFFCKTLCPSTPTRTQAPIVPRWPHTNQPPCP